MESVMSAVAAGGGSRVRRWASLGGGYALSSWCERDAVESAAAVIAVSNGMKADVLCTYPSVGPEKARWNQAATAG